LVKASQKELNMQHAVHNRAHIRVADRTDVSGRATADQVNLDRFHNRIRKIDALVAATQIPSSLRWMLLFAVLIIPQALWGAASAPATPQPTPGQTWYANVGAQSNDKGHQALAFLPNEIWIHAGDSITWTFDADELHTVTFIPDEGPRPFFQTVNGSPSGSQFPDPTHPETTVVSSPGGFADLGGIGGQPPPPNAFVKGDTFTVNFPTPGNYKQVCLFHNNMTGVVHVLEATQELPHDQDFYDRQAADQRRDLLSDRDGRSVAACGECAAHNSLKARVVTAGTGEISATAGGTQTLSVMRFLADQIFIRAGDTVEWTNQSPVEAHTVTFGTAPTGLAIFAPSANVTTDTDGALHAFINSNADNVSSGIIAAAAQDPNGGMGNQTPLGLTRFRVTFNKAGTFPYVCLLHDDLGMKGMVIVLPVPPQ
jgi:plastocyanin